MQITRYALGIVTAIVLATGTGATAVAGAAAASHPGSGPVSATRILADDNPGPLNP